MTTLPHTATWICPVNVGGHWILVVLLTSGFIKQNIFFTENGCCVYITNKIYKLFWTHYKRKIHCITFCSLDYFKMLLNQISKWTTRAVESSFWRCEQYWFKWLRWMYILTLTLCSLQNNIWKAKTSTSLKTTQKRSQLQEKLQPLLKCQGTHYVVCLEQLLFILNSASSV